MSGDPRYASGSIQATGQFSISGDNGNSIPLPPVPRELVRLEDELQRLNDALSAFESRLSTLMLPPMAGGQIPKNGDGPPLMCHIASRIMLTANRAAELGDMVHSLMSRLEL